MSFSVEIKGNTVWSRISGEVDMQVASPWREALEQQLGATLARNLTFDFSQVSFIDSSGLGVVLGRYKRVSSRGGRVRITGASPQVYRILELSGFCRLMEVDKPPGTPDGAAMAGGLKI